MRRIDLKDLFGYLQVQAAGADIDFPFEVSLKHVTFFCFAAKFVGFLGLMIVQMKEVKNLLSVSCCKNNCDSSLERVLSDIAKLHSSSC